MKKIILLLFITQLCLPLFANDQSSFVGSWNCTLVDTIFYEIELPDVQDYIPMIPSEESKQRDWERMLWREWSLNLSSDDYITSGFFQDSEKIILTLNEDHTGSLDIDEMDVFLWKEKDDDLIISGPGFDEEGMKMKITPILDSENPTFYLWMYFFDEYSHSLGIECLMLRVNL